MLPRQPSVLLAVQEEMKQWVGRSDIVAELESYIHTTKPLPLVWFISGPHGTGKTDVSKAVASLAFGLGYLPTDKHAIIPSDWIYPSVAQTGSDDEVRELGETLDKYHNETLMIDDDENVLDLAFIQKLIQMAHERGISLHFVSMLPYGANSNNDTATIATTAPGVLHLSALPPSDLVVILHRHLHRHLGNSRSFALPPDPNTKQLQPAPPQKFVSSLANPASQAPNNASDMVDFAQFLARQLTTIWSGTEDLLLTDDEIAISWQMFLDEAYGLLLA